MYRVFLSLPHDFLSRNFESFSRASHFATSRRVEAHIYDQRNNLIASWSPENGLRKY